jgi:hypothetical protein
MQFNMVERREKEGVFEDTMTKIDPTLGISHVTFSPFT